MKAKKVIFVVTKEVSVDIYEDTKETYRRLIKDLKHGYNVVSGGDYSFENGKIVSVKPKEG